MTLWVKTFHSNKERPMPAHKKEHTTPEDSQSRTPESSAPTLPAPEEFHRYLRSQIRDATRVVMEEIMQEELQQFVGAAWGEHPPNRKGYRNGFYTRDLATTSGPMEDVNVPRDRAGEFHTQVFERSNRYEQQVAHGLTEMFVSGTSTHKVGEVAQTLMGVAPSASAVSRLNHSLTEQFDAWRVRPLLPHYRILYLDGIHFRVRHGTQTDSTIILTALSVDLEGNKEVLALRACAQEDKDGWRCLLQDLRNRGVTTIDLIVTDGHDGLLAATTSLFTATPRQRCVVHTQRNVLNAIPHRERQEVATELTGNGRAGKERGCAAQSEREHSPNTRNGIPKPYAA
jgi:putative transposase